MYCIKCQIYKKAQIEASPHVTILKTARFFNGVRGYCGSKLSDEIMVETDTLLTNICCLSWQEREPKHIICITVNQMEIRQLFCVDLQDIGSAHVVCTLLRERMWPRPPVNVI